MVWLDWTGGYYSDALCKHKLRLIILDNLDLCNGVGRSLKVCVGGGGGGPLAIAQIQAGGGVPLAT